MALNCVSQLAGRDPELFSIGSWLLGQFFLFVLFM